MVVLLDSVNDDRGDPLMAPISPDAGEEPSLDEWADAYANAEAYFNALGIRNKLLLSRLVFRVLRRAERRRETEPDRHPAALAADETDRLVDEWFRQVLDEPLTGGSPRLSVRGRLALLLADMPNRWQPQFLADPPWPEEFVRAMRESYLRAGPDFQVSHMQPRPIDLGPVDAAARTIISLGRRPILRMVVVWLLFAGALAALFYFTR